MSEHEHIPTETVRQFVDGHLDAAASEWVMTEMAACDLCLATVDAMWTERPIGHAGTVELDKPTAHRMERQVLSRINRSNFANKVLTLGTSGFSAVAFALLRPLLGGKREEQRDD